MTAFIVYHTPNTGPGYFLSGDETEGFGGTYRLSEASKFKTKAAAEKVARNRGGGLAIHKYHETLTWPDLRGLWQ